MDIAEFRTGFRAWIDERMRFWGREGVWVQADIETAISTGSRIVEVNSTDPTQVDIVIPATVVPGLAKLGVYGQRVPASPACTSTRALAPVASCSRRYARNCWRARSPASRYRFRRISYALSIRCGMLTKKPEQNDFGDMHET